MLSASSTVIPALQSTPIDVPLPSETPSIRAPYRPPAKGEDIETTLSSTLQRALEELIRAGGALPLDDSPTEATPTIPPTLDELNSRVRLAIAGDGFFLVQAGSQRLLTRDGNFQFNDRYELVTEQGHRVLGYGANADGELQTGQLVPLSLPIAQEIAQPTTQVSFIGVLNPSSDPEQIASDEFEIFDPEGNAITVKIDVALLSNAADSTTFEWKIRYAAGTNEISEATGLLEFDANGDLSQGNLAHLFIETPTSAFSITLDFDPLTALGETDAQGNPISSIHGWKGDGFAPGRLFDVIVTEDGKLQGQFDTGFQLPLGQVVLGKVANPHGLQRVGTGNYNVSATSGQLIVGEPGNGGLGSVVSVPEGFSIRHDGRFAADDDPAPAPDTVTDPHPFGLQYPWLVRSASVDLSGNEYFIVEAADGSHQYTRDGRFRLNSSYELVTVDGLRVLGYPLDANGDVDRSTLAPLTIPFEQRTARATENVEFAGNLVPTSAVATTPGILKSNVLLNGAIESPDASAITVTPVRLLDPGEALTIRSSNYSFTFYNPTTQLESRPALSYGLHGLLIGDEFLLNHLPVPTSDLFTHVRIYRSVSGEIGPPRLLAEVQTGGPAGVTSYLDQTPDDFIRANPQLDFDGPTAMEETPLVDLLIRDGNRYSRLLGQGALSISNDNNSINPSKQSLTIDEDTTVKELLEFLESALTLDLSPEAADLRFDRVEFVDGKIVLLSSFAAQNEIDLPFPSFVFARHGNVSFPGTITDFIVTELDNGELVVTLVPQRSWTSTFNSFVSRKPSIFPSNSQELVAESIR
ncbi:MAG: flagellar hook-basal body complex protein, partial [Planctomycetota bacterium]